MESKTLEEVVDKINSFKEKVYNINNSMSDKESLLSEVNDFNLLIDEEYKKLKNIIPLLWKIILIKNYPI